MPDAAKIQELRVDHRNRQVRWGFIWALWCAVLWGAWYVPGGAIAVERPFSELGSGTGDQLLSAFVITAMNAVACLIAMAIWVLVLGKGREYTSTFRAVRISKWYAPAGLCGMAAIFGSYLAIIYVGPVFGAVAGLLYPIVGAVAAKLWYNENITGRAGIGILVIVIGGVVIYAPGILAELSGTGSGSWLGYLGGVLAIFGWGLEGAIAGRALDVSDPDVGLTLRFTAETVYWIVIALPIAAILSGGKVFTLIGGALTNPADYLLLVLLGLTFGFCYVSWYKSFPLIGVGRGQAIGALYGPFAVLWLFMFTLEPPDLNFAIGAVVAVLGGFVLYTEKRDVLEVIRAVPTRTVGQSGGGGERTREGV
jgi:drug/metabolite transporter (DMT)-like permease